MKEAPRRVSEGRQDGREPHEHLQGGFPHWCSGVLVPAPELRGDVMWISVCHPCSSSAGAQCTQACIFLERQLSELFHFHRRGSSHTAHPEAVPCLEASEVRSAVLGAVCTATPRNCLESFDVEACKTYSAPEFL